MRRPAPFMWTTVICVALVAGCGSNVVPSPSPSAVSVAPATPTTAATATSTPTLTPSPTPTPTPTFVVPTTPTDLHVLLFGDSWSSGAHCGGCEAFPSLYGDGLATATGRGVDLRVISDPETARELLSTIKSDHQMRMAVATADVIVTAIGTNDLEPALDSYAAGTCGGADELDCFRAEVATLATTFDGILTEIDTLRADQPTAVRVVSLSNEFISEPELADLLGEDFGATKGVTVTNLMADMYCQAAAAHNATCVPLGPVLNGSDLLTPAEINTQENMQAVADAILATGVDELE